MACLCFQRSGGDGKLRFFVVETQWREIEFRRRMGLQDVAQDRNRLQFSTLRITLRELLIFHLHLVGLDFPERFQFPGAPVAIDELGKGVK